MATETGSAAEPSGPDARKDVGAEAQPMADLRGLTKTIAWCLDFVGTLLVIAGVLLAVGAIALVVGYFRGRRGELFIAAASCGFGSLLCIVNAILVTSLGRYLTRFTAMFVEHCASPTRNDPHIPSDV